MTTERSRNRSSGFYSVDSVFVIFGVGIDFSTVRSGQNASSWSHKFFIFKCVPTSQADIHSTTGNTENKGARQTPSVTAFRPCRQNPASK